MGGARLRALHGRRRDQPGDRPLLGGSDRRLHAFRGCQHGQLRDRPYGWTSVKAPVIEDDAQRSIYELHVRDFSAADKSVPEDMRGTYMAFTQYESNGMRHLSQLAEAGMNTVHLLPTFDIATLSLIHI